MRKIVITIAILVLTVNAFAQDSTNQKHPLFKISGVSALVSGGGSIGNFNQTASKQTLVNMFPEVANRPYYNYPNFSCNNQGGGSMFGAYVSLDTYSKKKKRYAIHSQTNIGFSVFGYDGLTANFTNSTATRIDTLFVKQGSTYVPSYYHDNVTTNYANVSYHSTNMGLDVQQLLTTNQKWIISVFIGVGFTVNFSTVSQINETQSTEGSINLTPYPNYNYQNYLANNYYNPANPVFNNTSSSNTYNAHTSVLYQAYIPFGFNVRLGKKDKKTISHFYFTTQVRIGYEIVKIQTVNAFAFSNDCISIGAKYRF
ncbi:MAG: hypothetical protein ACYDCN_14570 [Bacteroidia bacterium]